MSKRAANRICRDDKCNARDCNSVANYKMRTWMLVQS